MLALASTYGVFSRSGNNFCVVFLVKPVLAAGLIRNAPSLLSTVQLRVNGQELPLVLTGDGDRPASWRLPP